VTASSAAARVIAFDCRLARPGFAFEAAFETGPGVTALFGPSGAGKSTALALLAGLERPDAGRIALDGAAVVDTASRIWTPAHRRRIGMVFQDSRLFPHMSVRANLLYGRWFTPAAARRVALDPVVEVLGVGHLLDRRPASLSGGERQRVALGRALLARPRLLLMDEPLAALDAARRAEVLPFIARLRQVARIPILYVTHALEEVDALADELVLLEGGRVRAAGPVEALTARADLPLALRRDAGVLLACTVAGPAAGGLTRLDFAGGSLLTTQRAGPPGARLRVRVRARDVAVAVVEPRGLSTRNILPATLVALQEIEGAEEVFARLAIGPGTILARITAESVRELGLVPGMAVWALLKAVTFDHRAAETGAPR
jgi:molybdate transport system ATP-binding protein